MQGGVSLKQDGCVGDSKHKTQEVGVVLAVPSRGGGAVLA